MILLIRSYKIKYNKKVVLLFIIIFLGNLSECSKINQIRDTAINNIVTESELTKYNLDTKIYDKISYGNNIYLITNEEIDIKLIGEPIGKVSYSCMLDENKIKPSKDESRKMDISGNGNGKNRYKLIFGWIHEIKGENTVDEVAVNINHLYYKCKLEK